MPHNPLRRYAELHDERLTRQAARSLRAFVEQAWPVLEPTTPLLPNWHIDLVCEHLEAITAGETTRLLINLPPRYMKSLLVSVFWPVWEWIASPSRRWICVSYSDALSLKLSLDRRTLVQSAWYQARWGHTVQLSSDQNVKGGVPEYPPGRHVCHLGRRLRDGQRRRSDHRGRSAQPPTGGQ